MLLACCFREPKSKQEKRNKNGQKLAATTDDEDAYVLSKSLISAPVPVGKEDSPKTKKKKPGGDKAAAKDQRSDIVIQPGPSQNGLFTNNGSKKKIKAVVEESKLSVTPKASKEDSKHQQNSAIKQPSFNASTPVTKPPASAHNQIFSPPNFTNISAIKKKEEVRDVRRMLATPEDLDESYISLSKINPVSLSNCSKESLSAKKSSDEEVLSKDNLTFTKENKNNNDDNHNKLDHYLQENLELKQIIEEQKHKFELQEKSINALKHEYESQIVSLQKEQSSRLQEEKNLYHLKLLEEKEKHRKEMENIKIIAKNSANETISQLNKQIVTERAKIFTEQQEMKETMENEFRLKEEKLQKSLACLEESLTMVEKRELEWQEEKADILKEVQRLKAEASKMVAILAAEYEEENLSEEKKRSLSAEVYSLQLVVEMRTGEVKTLRSKLGSMTHQLETAAATQTKLDKAQARVEDLEEQLRVKKQFERQLSEANTELEERNANSSKVVDRMSKNVEQLQWRIRNNFDVPVEGVIPTSITYRDHQQMSTTVETHHNSSQLTSPTLVEKISKENVINVNLASPKKSLFVVSDEMIEATTTIDKLVHSSDISPCSDFTDDSIDACENDEDDKSVNNDVEDLDHDADSLDEGVGDISSDGEHQLSPGFVDKLSLTTTNSSAETVITNHQSQMVTNSSSSVNMRCDKSDNSDLDQLRRLSSPRLSPVKERMPSRFSFNNTA